jgi:RNA polymerase sigma-70 factor (ECF subfamily)
LTSVLASELPADTTRQLYERHSSRIFGFCLSRLGSREEAEDAVQTTFLNAQRGLGRGVVPEYELAWLFKIAQNVCHNRHQSARRRGRVEGTQDIDALQDVIASPERSAAVSLGELTRALGAIPTRQRRALLLREFQGYSYEEIASELDVSVSAVETLVFRARRAVAHELEQQGATPRRSRGAAASIFELFRWLFGGAAGPAKLAALAAVATTATASLIPVGHAPATAPSSIAPQTNGLSAPARGVKTAQRRALHQNVARADMPATPAATAGSQELAPTTSAAESTAASSASPSQASSPASLPSVTVPPQPAAETALPAVTTPEVSVPSVTTPAVTTPVVSVPSVTLPALTVPAVTVPGVDLPKLP